MQKDAFILNFSGACLSQGLPDIIGAVTEDFSGLSGTFCYCDPDAEKELSARIAGIPAGALHFIDSGDYHYVSALFCRRITSPFSLILLDNHPDMQPPAFGDMLSCGGWVSSILDSCPNLQKVLLLGADPSLKDETMRGRVECLFRDEISSDPETAVRTVENLQGPVYISIDKDVLSVAHAATDWSQGDMTPEIMDAILTAAFRSHEVAGVDICGELPASKGGNSSSDGLNLSVNIHLKRLIDRLISEYCPC